MPTPILNKYEDVSVDPNAPWDGDIFARREHGLRISALIASLTNPHVISVKGDWGTGKTVFLRRLAAQLEAEKTPVIFVDAWRSDYLEDPLLAFVSATDARLRAYLATDKSEARSRKAKGLAASLASYGSKLIVPTTKVLTAAIPGANGIIDASAELVEKLGTTLLDWEKSQRTAEQEFRKALVETRNLLTHKDKMRPVRRPMVFIIDELDRCRPDYAISALERIKHFFDVEGVIFVLATDKTNLPAAVHSVYGSDPAQSERYLRKFIDIEYTLPRPNNPAFARSLADHFGLTDIANRVNYDDWWRTYQDAYSNSGAYDQLYTSDPEAVNAHEAIHIFPRIADAWNLGLRDQAQAFNLLNLCMRTMGRKDVCFPQVLAYLCCLRFHAPTLFAEFLSGDLQLGEVTTTVRDGLRKPRWLDPSDDEGADLMAFVNLSAQSAAEVQRVLGDLCNSSRNPEQTGAAYRRIRARAGNAARTRVTGFARDAVSLSKAFAPDDEEAAT